jgi:hypothetical protein
VVERHSSVLLGRVDSVAGSVEKSREELARDVADVSMELARRFEALGGEVYALYVKLGDLITSLEEAKLELLNAVDAVAHQVDTYREEAVERAIAGHV